jgi:alpha-pyrone synthase
MNAKVMLSQASWAKSGIKSNGLGLPTVLPVIERIATGTPDRIVPQAEAAQFVANLPSLVKNRSRIEKIYENTRIEKRNLAVNLFSEETIAFTSQRGTLAARMALYLQSAVPLAEQVVKRVLADVDLATVGQIVFVSSTGFVAPGIDTELIKRLGLRRDIARVTVNFMGCAAAMNGLRVGSDYVRSHPMHKSLVICLELSSINAVFEDELNDIIIHSIFGDGCAAVVLGARDLDTLAGLVGSGSTAGQLVIRDHLSYLVEDTEDGITLGIQDNGITCKLSRQLPDYIEAGVGRVVKQFLDGHHLSQADIDLWAVHPGGTRIIEKAQAALGLTDRQVACSWEILRQYGNMLSCSVLFVMEQMLHDHLRDCSATLRERHPDAAADAATGLAFSFSPGVGIEGVLFQVI